MKNSYLLIIFIISLIFTNECITTDEYSYYRNQDMSEESVWEKLRDKAAEDFFRTNFVTIYSKQERFQEEINDIYSDHWSSYQLFIRGGQIEIDFIDKKIDGRTHITRFEICYDRDKILEEIESRVKSQQEDKLIAVVGFVSDGLSTTMRNLFKDKLEEQVKLISPYELLSYQKVDRILKESGIITTEQCNNEACAVDLGRDLNVDLVLQPNIIFDKDSESTIGLTIFNVETGKIVAKLFEFKEVTSFNGLLRSLDKFVMDLIIKATGGYTSPVSSEEKRESSSNGLISISTTPQGATILLDSQDMGKTNKLLDNVEAGEHIVVLSLPGYTRIVKRINVIPSQTFSIDETLLKDMGALSISSKPDGAKIYLNGKLKGTIDEKLQISYLEIGDYRITARFDNYEEYISTITVEKDRTTDIFISLEPIPAKVRIFSTPSDAQIFVNDEYIGLTTSSGFLEEFLPGSYKITIKLENYFEEEKVIQTFPGGSDLVDLNLRRLPKGKSSNKDMGFVSGTIFPENPLIKINNKNINESKLDYHQLLRGDYKLKISSPSFKSYKSDFSIIAQKHNQLKSINLKPIDLKIAGKRSMIFPGLGHFYAEEYGKGTAWMFGAFASLLFINSSFSDYTDKDNIHNDALNAYNAATDNISEYALAYQNAYDDREKSMYVLTGSVVTLIGVWIANVFDFKKTLKKYNSIQNNYKRINLQMKGNQIEMNVKF